MTPLSQAVARGTLGAVTSRLVVLGSCGAWPEPGRACSGFFLEHEGTRVVLDLGYGTLPRLLSLLGSSVATGLDAVIVTHRHPDHMVDLHGLFRARWFGNRQAATLPVYAPDDVRARVAALEEDDVAAVEHVFDWFPLPAEPRRIGPFRLESVPVPHFVPAVGVRLSSPELTVAYTGDTGPDSALAELGHGADLYIMDATDRYQCTGGTAATAEQELDLTAGQAARAATAAGARQLMLTHFWPGNDRERSRADAAQHFTGEILLAGEGLQVPLG